MTFNKYFISNSFAGNNNAHLSDAPTLLFIPLS